MSDKPAHADLARETNCKRWHRMLHKSKLFVAGKGEKLSLVENLETDHKEAIEDTETQNNLKWRRSKSWRVETHKGVEKKEKFHPSLMIIVIWSSTVCW